MNANDLNTSDSSLSEYGQDDSHPAALPLGVGGFEADGADALAGAVDESKSRAGQLLLGLVVVVAIGGLFFMRTLARVTLAATSAESETMVEEFLSGRDAEGTGSVADLRIATIEVLTESYQERQVPKDDLKKQDPFVIADVPRNPDLPISEQNPGATAEAIFNQKVAAAEKTFEQAVAKLKLQSVLMGSNPVANISGSVVRTGDKVRAADTEFIVKDITADEAQLEARDDSLSIIRTYTIRIDRP